MYCHTAFLAIWYSALIVAEPLELAHQRRIVELSAAVVAGMTPGEVTALLGEPDAEYAARAGAAALVLGPRPKQWMYGTVLNLDYLAVAELPIPNPVPVNLRIFDYAENDLVIDWSRSGAVTAVHRPKFPVPDGADAMLAFLYFIDFVAKSLVLPAWQ